MIRVQEAVLGVIAKQTASMRLFRDSAAAYRQLLLNRNSWDRHTQFSYLSDFLSVLQVLVQPHFALL